MSFFSIVRIVVFALLLLFALVVAALSAHLLYVERTSEDFVTLSYIPDFEVVGIVVGVINVLVLPIFLAVGLMKSQIFLTMIAVEIPAIGFLWILWVSESARVAAWFSLFFPTGCSDSFFEDVPVIVTFCHEMQAVEAFCFIAWIILLLYDLTLVVFSIVAMSRGNKRIWSTSVAQADFFTRSASATNNHASYGKLNELPIMQPPSSYPPMQSTPNPVPQHNYNQAPPQTYTPQTYTPQPYAPQTYSPSPNNPHAQGPGGYPQSMTPMPQV